MTLTRNNIATLRQLFVDHNHPVIFASRFVFDDMLEALREEVEGEQCIAIHRPDHAQAMFMTWETQYVKKRRPQALIIRMPLLTQGIAIKGDAVAVVSDMAIDDPYVVQAFTRVNRVGNLAPTYLINARA